MAGEDIQSWSVTAANNGNSDSAIEWREGQTRASVNNSSRSEMAAIAKHRNLLNGSISTTNSGNAYAFTSGVGYTVIPAGLRVKLKIATTTNTGSATLNMDGIGDVTIKDDQGVNLKGGELVANAYTDLLYNGTNWIFLYSHAYLYELITGGGGIIVGTQVFSTAGTFTYTPTPGMEACVIECVGGGGGGNGMQGQAGTLQTAGGGGGGAYARKHASATDIGASQTVIVGAGGAGGSWSGNVPGSPGGDTSVGTLCVAKGATSSAGWHIGGNGGPVAGCVGDFAAAGGPGLGGNYSVTSSNDFVTIGGGGNSYFGGGAPSTAWPPDGNYTSPAASNAYGGGGAGGSLNNTGAGLFGSNGFSGVVIITEFAGRGAAGRDGATGPIGPAGPSGSGTGDVLRLGTPTAGQVAVWTDASHIQGVAASTLIAGITDIVIQKFTASGTYTPTAGMKVCIIECVGGGGGGGGLAGAAGWVYTAGSGGSGGYSRKRATAAEIGASKPVTIGAGGAGGIWNVLAGVGSAGSDTSVGALCVAKGALAQSSQFVGGQAGPAGVGDMTSAGASGGGGGAIVNTAGAVASSPGGSSYFGGGAPAQSWATDGTFRLGLVATGYGGGGGGASINNAGAGPSGGNGAAGVVIITEYI